MLSDHDPEGEDIGHSFARSMRDDFDIPDVEPIKVALTRQQVIEMNLPPMMKAKEKSSRRKGFVGRHGDDVFELEAVEPERLQDLLRETIDAVIDMKAFEHEQEQERQDAARLKGIRRQVMALLRQANIQTSLDGEVAP